MENCLLTHMCDMVNMEFVSRVFVISFCIQLKTTHIATRWTEADIFVTVLLDNIC